MIPPKPKEYTRHCLRKGCYEEARAPFRDGMGRCPKHQREIDRKSADRKAARDGWPETSPCLMGFTPVTHPGTVGQTSTQRGHFTPILEGLDFNLTLSTGSLDEVKTYSPHFSEVALEKNLYAGDPVFVDLKKLFDKMQKPETKEAVRRAFASTSEQLGNAARLAASGVTDSERNLVQRLAHDQFLMGNYEAEQLLRGLLVRSDRVKSAEDDATRRYSQATDAQARADQLQRQLDAAVTVTQAQGKKVEELEKREADGYWRKLAERRAAELGYLKDPTWTTGEQKTIHPAQFVSAHLLNTIRFIENVQPEYAGEEDDRYWSGPGLTGPEKFPVYPFLLKEARQRGLLLCKDKLRVKPAELVDTEETT